MIAMIVGTRASVWAIVKWQKWAIIRFFAWAVFWTVLNHFVDLKLLHLTSLPFTIIGAALGIFVAFRTNSAYDRWWEGRKLWGRMVNASRLFAFQVMHYIRSTDACPQDAVMGRCRLQRHLLDRHAAYVHSLRVALRLDDPLEDEDVRRLLTDDELAGLQGDSNIPQAILHGQGDLVMDAVQRGWLDVHRLQQIDLLVHELLDVQGGCERIKKTPMPPIYGYIAGLLVRWYGALLPLALVSEIGWVTIPVSAFAAISFHMINETGRILEDPFTMFFNGLPLTQLSRMIEVNVRSRGPIDDGELPQIPAAVGGVLM